MSAARTPVILTLVTLGLAWGSAGAPSMEAVPLTVSSTNPPAESTQVPVGLPIQITFNGTLDPATLMPETVKLQAGNQEIKGTLTFKTIPAEDSAPITLVTFQPLYELESYTTYTVKIPGAVFNVARNPMRADYSFRFTTGAAPSMRGCGGG